jgi:hypothetical protein
MAVDSQHGRHRYLASLDSLDKLGRPMFEDFAGLLNAALTDVEKVGGPPSTRSVHSGSTSGLRESTN